MKNKKCSNCKNKRKCHVWRALNSIFNLVVGERLNVAIAEKCRDFEEKE